MTRYRGVNQHREAHPKIYIWSHTKKAEIEYFQDFKNHLSSSLLIPKKFICGSPKELLKEVIKWKKEKSKLNDEDGDQVWCIFDIDDFYKNDKDELLKMTKGAIDNNIKIAYANECFELWILLHFQTPSASIAKGRIIEEKVQKEFKRKNLGKFKKNQKVFDMLLPFQADAIKNAQKILNKYEDINWNLQMSEKGNPSTSIHFLIKEINKNIKKK